MMTLLEDLRLALRQICSEIGREGTAATAVPLVVLGLALNFAALSATEFVRHGGRPIHQHSALRNAARTELNAVRIVVHSAIRKINATQQRWGRTQQWVKDGQKKIDGYHVEVGVRLGSLHPQRGLWHKASGKHGVDKDGCRRAVLVLLRLD